MRSWLRRQIPLDMALLALALVALNVVDAKCTLRHIAHGAMEINPVMQFMLRRGVGWFLAFKMGLATCGSVGLATRRTRAAKIALMVLVGLYALIAAYQLVLFLVIK